MPTWLESKVAEAPTSPRLLPSGGTRVTRRRVLGPRGKAEAVHGIAMDSKRSLPGEVAVARFAFEYDIRHARDVARRGVTPQIRGRSVVGREVAVEVSARVEDLGAVGALVLRPLVHVVDVHVEVGLR